MAINPKEIHKPTHRNPCMLYIVTFTINIPQMLAYIPYMDPMANNDKNIPQNYPWGEDFPSLENMSHPDRNMSMGPMVWMKSETLELFLWSCREPSLGLCVYLCLPSPIFITGHTAISKGTSCRPSISNHFHAIVGFPTSFSSLHQFAKLWAVSIVSTQIRWSIHGDLHLDAYSNLDPSMTAKKGAECSSGQQKVYQGPKNI